MRAQASRPALRPRAHGPGVAAVVLVFAVVLVLLVANGRPIGAPDPGGAAGWLWRGALALAGAGGLELDATGAAVVGKLLAAVFAALAAAALFAAVARRQAADDARWSAFALALGTTLAAAAQAWSGEAPATAAVALALWVLARAEQDDTPGEAARAGLPLALAGALQPTAIPLALVLAVAVAVRWRNCGLALLGWVAAGAIPGIVGVVAAAGSRAVGPPADPGPLALVASPAKGALVFAPVVIVGLVGLGRALASRRSSRLWDQPEPDRMLPAACALAFLAHLTTVTVVGGWSGGTFWGPKLLAPAWPLLLLFLPEGLAALKLVGTLLVLLSIAVQALGALTYDGRWDRLHRSGDGRLAAAAAWSWPRSPLVFQWRERVARPSLLGIEGKRVVVREHALVRSGETGSFVSFGGGSLRPTGADATMEALRLDQGARVEGDRLELRAAGDGIAFRVREGARPRRLEIRIAGRGQGTLAVSEKGFWAAPRVRERAVSGAFRVRFPYAFADSHAADLAVTLLAGGPLSIESVSLVPPTEPENVIRLP